MFLQIGGDQAHHCSDHPVNVDLELVARVFSEHRFEVCNDLAGAMTSSHNFIQRITCLVDCKNKVAFPEKFSSPPVGRGNVPGPFSLNDQARSRMRFTL